MHYFGLFIIILAGISGLYLGIVGFRQYTNITRTAEKVTTLQVIKIAARLSLASSLVFFATLNFGGVLDEDHIWSFYQLGGSALGSLIFGLLVSLGVAYQIYTTVVFRDMLIRKYKEKDKSENHNG